MKLTQNCVVAVLPLILKDHAGIKKWQVDLSEFSISLVKKTVTF